MYQIKYNEPVHIHFIGIGGISMSGLGRCFAKTRLYGKRLRRAQN